MARSVIFVNDMGGPILDEWVLDELDGRVVPDGGTLDVTDEVTDDELMHAIQSGLGLEFIDGKRYLRINGIDKTAAESLNYGNMAEGPDPAPHAIGGSDHTPSTLAELNAKVSDAVLDDAGDPRDPTAHASTHVGGSDPIAEATPSVSGLMSAERMRELMNSLMTGLRDGGIPTVNVDPTKFDLSAGVGLIVDSHTDPSNPVVTVATWSAMTGVTPAGFGISEVTFIGIDGTGSLYQKTTEFTYEEKRDYIFLAAIVHPTLAGTITQIHTGPRLTGGRDADASDFFDAFGPFNVDGNAIQPNASDLKIDRTSGNVWQVGGNYATSKKRPSIVTLPLAAQTALQYIYRDGSGDFIYPYPPAAQVDPGNWDDDSGSLQAVPAAKYTVQRIFMYSTDGHLACHYGQTLFDSMEEAEAAINLTFVMSPELHLTIFRAWLIVKGDATDLSNPAQAKFVLAGKFGLATVMTGAGGGEANTASNVGSAGVGLFKQKAVVDLEFHKLSSASAAITVAYDAGTDTVRLTFALPVHKDSHVSGGSDAFLSTDLIDAVVRRLRETGGPTDLLLAAIADGQYLARSGATVAGVTPPIFGQNEQRSVQDAEASVTGTTAWNTLHTWTTGTLPAGTYKVMWSFDWAYSVTNRFMTRRVQVAGATVGGPWAVQRTLAYPNWQLASGFAFFTVATPGTQTINVDVMPMNIADTAYIIRSRLEVIRVA